MRNWTFRPHLSNTVYPSSNRIARASGGGADEAYQQICKCSHTRMDFIPPAFHKQRAMGRQRILQYYYNCVLFAKKRSKDVVVTLGSLFF